MKTTNWRTVAELTGMAAIVASLIFLAMEVRQNHQVGRTETGLALLQSLQQGHEMVLANTDVWVRGCRGDELNDIDRAQFAMLVRGYVQRIYFVWLTSEDSILDLGSVTPADHFARTFHRYPGFSTMVLLQGEWLGHNDEQDIRPIDELRFRDDVTSRILKLRETEPNPEFDPALCGI